MITTISAPGKLMLVGSYAVVHGRPAVVTAVDQRIHVTVELIESPHLELVSSTLETGSFHQPLMKLGEEKVPQAARFVVAALKVFLEAFPGVLATGGVKISTQADFSSSFGFGSSSAVTVAEVSALAAATGVMLSQQQVFELAYQAVLEVQGVGSGFDVAAATWGGTLRYVPPQWVKAGETGVTPLGGAAAQLPQHLVVAYTGQKADTPTLVKRVNAQLESDPNRFQSIFDAIGAAADDLTQALVDGDWTAAGRALTTAHHQVAQLGVSTPQLDNMVAAAQAAGAFGASLSGAGGGDCMVAIVPPSHRAAVEQALSHHGQIMSVVVGAAGAVPDPQT